VSLRRSMKATGAAVEASCSAGTAVSEDMISFRKLKISMN
jgi:hypothetical protein